MEGMAVGLGPSRRLSGRKIGSVINESVMRGAFVLLFCSPLWLCMCFVQAGPDQSQLALA